MVGKRFKLKPVLGPALWISSREINKLSEGELMELARLGLSLVGWSGRGMRSAIYDVKKNLGTIMKKLDEKGVKYKPMIVGRWEEIGIS